MNFVFSTTLQDKAMAETTAVCIFITLLQLEEFIDKFCVLQFFDNP